MKFDLYTTDKKLLTPEEAAEALGCTAQLLRMAARDPVKRQTLGFQIMCIGNRVKIPTAGLRRFLDGNTFEVETSAEKTAKSFYDELERSGVDKEAVLTRLSELVYDNEAV